MMISMQDFIKINDYEWVIPKTFRKTMNVPVRFFSTRKLLESAAKDRSLEQAVNAAALPGLVGEVKVMPDVHQGYGFPIGGVAASAYPDGVISPGGIGYDINCGVRLLASSIPKEVAEPLLEELVIEVNRKCPSGVGVKGSINLSGKELDDVCRLGAKWVQKRGMASEEDIRRTESFGQLEGADPGKMSPRARERGRPQLGTLGAGNHFLEAGYVEQIFDPQAAEIMGLKEDSITFMVHSGSRGLGHQVCSDYVKKFQNAVRRYGINLPDRELVCAPLDSEEGMDYLAGMHAAANYAFANRQVLAHYVRQAFEVVFAGRVNDWDLHQVYDITHNMGNVEYHEIDGKRKKVCVHRKGATRAFGPGASGLPDEYSSIGQP
ncbi:MAG: RtcB family protein, partial [Anaerolineaceae bacterium]|nr:RtcB family protein [Anaerolineaceae bacterium]